MKKHAARKLGKVNQETREVNVFLLQLEKTKKELDERFFNDEQRKEFDKSDAKEWETWVRTQAIDLKPLSREEAARVVRQPHRRRGRGRSIRRRIQRLRLPH